MTALTDIISLTDSALTELNSIETNIAQRIAELTKVDEKERVKGYRAYRSAAKGGGYKYLIIDDRGDVIGTRTSKREYNSMVIETSKSEVWSYHSRVELAEKNADTLRAGAANPETIMSADLKFGVITIYDTGN